MKISEIISETARTAGGAPPGPAPAGVINQFAADNPNSPLANDKELPDFEIKNRKYMKDRDKSVFTKNTVHMPDIDNVDRERSKKKKPKIKHIYYPAPFPGMSF